MSDNSQKQQIVLITGCSTGLGKDMAVVLAKRGYLVYASMRDLAKKDLLLKDAETQGASSSNIRLLQLDVTSTESVNTAVNEIVEKEGRIDVVINNAGYALGGSVEQVTIDQAQAEFNTNFFGVMRVMQAVLPQMRKQKSGHIINISSGIALMGIPKGVNGIYAATKAALESISEAEAPILEKFGIKLSVVEPGITESDLGKAMAWGDRLKDQGDPYDSISSFWKGFFTNIPPQMVDPSTLVSDTIVGLIEGKEQHFRTQTGNAMKQAASQLLTDPTGEQAMAQAKARLG